jgi:tRNA pseudouridine55 synthase
LITGILLIDKPSGITSHDVVARMRRVLQERRIGHAGTLDPMATGLLVLIVGKATRLSSLLTGHDKTYDATVRLGQTTSTDDADGDPTGEPGPVPEEAQIRAALSTFEGTFAQRPPAHSAKKIGGTRAYRLARAHKAVDLAPVEVTVRGLTWQGFERSDLRLRVEATAGFYVRSLARELGARLGCGGHLTALRRVRSGSFVVEDAISLMEAELLGPATAGRLIAPADALSELAAVEVTQEGFRRVQHGNLIEAGHLVGEMPAGVGETPIRILSDGRLVALARPRTGALHPVVVLG